MVVDPRADVNCTDGAGRPLLVDTAQFDVDAATVNPQAASVGSTEAPFRGTAPMSALPKMETYSRAYADSSRIALEEQLSATPDNAQQRIFLGLALAYLGRKADAIREGERGVALLPISKDGYTGPYLQHQLARIYILVGEPDKAIDQLGPLLEVPYFLSPAWLKIDPTFDPLRSHPRFQQLVNR